MSFWVHQSTARRFVLKAYLSSDHVTAATGKTLAVVVSRNGGAFANPNAGATTATEIGSGWYYADLDTTDTGTVGPLIVRATGTGVDDVERTFLVVKATNLSMTGIPDAAANVAGGLPVVGSAPLANLDATVSSRSTAADLNSAMTSQGYTTTRAPYLDRLALLLLDGGGRVTVGSNADKTGYVLTSAYDAAKTASQFNASSDKVTLASGTHTGAVIPTVTAVTNAVSLPSPAPAGYGGSVDTTDVADAVVAALAAEPIVFRDVSSVTAPTIMDAWAAAFTVGAGDMDNSTGTSLVLRQPDGKAVFRTFAVTLDARGQAIART